MPNKFYITTPIYYVNDKPHIGHAYTTFMADILARYHRMKGNNVFFLTGTDENSQKNIEAAKRAGELSFASSYALRATEDKKASESKKNIQKYLNKMSAVWQGTWDSLGITHNDFIRTTEKRHHKAVVRFFDKVWEKGDIYEGVYEGWYCEGCEAFITEDDLIDGKCSHHKKKPKKIKEKNLFFKVTKYRDALLEYIGKNPEFIQPKSRRNEVISFIKDFMEDFSISREKTIWGVPVPLKAGEKHRHEVLYVWFDALINYISALDFGGDKKKFKKYWPADVHLVGKDIIKFHCAFWPAMLMSAGLPLPKKIFAHGFFTIDGEKMSKSRGNIADPIKITEKYGTDTLRYFFMREIRFGEDGDFSEEKIEERYNKELANELGNLVSRVLTMTEKYFKGRVPRKVSARLSYAWKQYDEDMENLKLNDAIEKVWQVVRETNRFIEIEQPWVLAKINKKRLERDIYILLETLRNLGWMLWPIMPESAEKIWAQLGISKTEKKLNYEEAKAWGGIKPGGRIKRGDTLFPKT